MNDLPPEPSDQLAELVAYLHALPDRGAELLARPDDPRCALVNELAAGLPARTKYDLACNLAELDWRFVVARGTAEGESRATRAAEAAFQQFIRDGSIQQAGCIYAYVVAAGKGAGEFDPEADEVRAVIRREARKWTEYLDCRIRNDKMGDTLKIVAILFAFDAELSGLGPGTSPAATGPAAGR